MIPLVNLNNIVAKGHELEHQTHQRTRRWIADANQNVYESWYPTKTNQISEFGRNPDEASKVAQIKSRKEYQNSILTRISNLETIASNSIQVLQQDGLSEYAIIQKLNIQYLIKGNLRKFGDKLRINTQLVNAHNNRVVWAEKYDAPMDSVFASSWAII